MKTPRELLLVRHRDAELKLDAIRRRVLARLPKARTNASSSHQDSAGIRGFFRAFLLAFRWHLAGLSAAWVVIALLNLDHRSAAVAPMAKEDVSSPRHLLTALRENRRQLLELLESPANLREPEPAGPAFVPKRRGELRTSHALACAECAISPLPGVCAALRPPANFCQASGLMIWNAA